MKLERIDRKLSYKGHIIDLYTDYIKTPSGRIAEWDFIKHKGAAACLPILPDGRIILIRQWRNALDQVIYEIPAGGKEEGEDFLTCARRELEEETGYASCDLEFLMDVNTTVAFCDEKIGIYVARNLTKTCQHLDQDEDVEVVDFKKEEILAMLEKGEITDSKTVAALYAYFYNTSPENP